MRLLIAKLDRPPYVFGKALYHSQSQAGAALAAGAKRAYTIAEHVLRKTGAIVEYINT